MNAEDHIRENRDKAGFGNIFDHAADALYIIDRKGILLDVNPAGLNLYGYIANEIVGYGLVKLLSPGHSDPGQVRHYIEEALKGTKQQFECLGEKKNGGVFPAEITLSRGNYFNKKSVLMMIRDVSEKHSALKAFRDSEEKYKSLTNQLPVGIYRSSTDGQLLYANPALVKMLNYDSLEEMLSINVADLYYKVSERDKQIQKALATPDVIKSEFQLRKKTGELIWVVDSARLVLDQEGRPKYFDGILEDITAKRKTEKALIQKDKIYRILFEAANDGIFIMQNNLFTDCNMAAVKMFGFKSPKELIGKNPWDMSPPIQPDGMKSVDKAAALIARAGKAERFFWKHLRADGEPFDVEVSLSRIKIDKENHIQAIVRDVTSALRSKKIIEENEANLKAIIENPLESVWSANKNYEIQYFNDVFFNAFKASFGIELYKGINIVESLPDEMRSRWLERYERAFRKEHFTFEEKIPTKTGVVYAEVSVNPIVVNDEVVAVCFYGRDVTEKRLAEEELKKQASLKQLLIEISSDYINLPLDSIDPAINHSLGIMGRFLGSEIARIFSYDSETRTCTQVHKWFAPGLIPGNDTDTAPFSDIGDVHAAHATGGVNYIYDYEAWLKNKDMKSGERHPDFRSLLSVPMINNDVCIGFIEFASITKPMEHSPGERELLTVYAQIVVNTRLRKKLEQELIKAREKAEESDRLKSAFLANMSHEIRTPMNGILGFMELLRTPDLTEENKNAYLDIVSLSGERLLNTINDIIEISKIESGEIRLNFTNVNLTDLCQFYQDFFSEQARKKGLKLEVAHNLPTDKREIMTDKYKLESIMVNLLRNAIKFTSSGTITFGCHPDGEAIVFFIRDTGMGISSENLPLIFDRFIQVDHSETRPYEGSGLGLAIVRAYSEMLGGTVVVESEKGKGSTFFVRIPSLQQVNGGISQ